MNDTKQDWPYLIRNYIDSTGDQKKQKEYQQLLLADFYKSQLMLATVTKEDEQKEFIKECKKVEKINVTASQSETLSSIYQAFVRKSWITGDSEKLEKLKKKSDFYNIWICKSLLEGEGVHPATHIAKLTHSSSGASSIFDRINEKDERYLTTSSLLSPSYDGAYPNGALSKNVKFLLLENQGLLSEEIYKGNMAPLAPFAEDELELSKWLSDFKAIFNAPLKSDSLAKQVYFPVGKGYHLLTPLTSSSVCQAIYEQCFVKEVREQIRKDKKYLDTATYNECIYSRTINTAKIATVASQPQNVSVLNGNRAGKIHLFSTQPPQWQTQLKAPLKQITLFDNLYLSSVSRTNIEYIRDFLLRFKKLELSIKHPKRKKWLEKWVQSIFEDVLNQVSYLHTLPAGWSAKSELKNEYQYFLDPYRNDPDFQARRIAEEWQPLICRGFAEWLNRLLAGKEKRFTPQPQHRKLWHTLVEQQLREFEQLLQIEPKVEGAES